MIKVFRFVAICTISVAIATLSIASAQIYTTIDFPWRDFHHSERRSQSAGHQRR